MNPKASFIKCIKCNEPLQADWPECPNCLTPTSSGGLVCSNPSCRKPLKENWKKCPYCHESLSGFITPPTARSDSGHEGHSGRPFVSEVPAGHRAGHGFGAELPIYPGDKLGDSDRYRIIKSIGEGGYAAVYHVEDTILKKQMALKVVVTGSGQAQSVVEQILHEFELYERITDTSYIIRTKDPRPCEYKELSLILLPMELADGGTLRDWLRQNPDTDGRCKQGIEYFKQVCSGLRAIHQSGLVHLDIKPDNVLIVGGRAKIADFGIGRFLAGKHANNPDQLLREGIGTPEYMSPEQFHVARQKNIGTASDIYSLGMVLFELLDGSLPFDGTPLELREKHLNMPVPSICGDKDHWQRIVERCLNKRPENRYSDIDGLIKDVDYTMQGLYSSVDVSCPKCRFINPDKDVQVCPKCKEDLHSLFRECPVCGRLVRKDVVDACRICGTDVAAYYLLQDRWERIERLKDEDLVEAIELLEIVLREGAGKYYEDALKLIRELRKRQEKVAVLIAVANEAYSSGNLDNAFDEWRQVLDIVPRNKRAFEQVQVLRAMLEEFRGNIESSKHLMDEGRFEQADKLLNRCMEIKPSDNDARDMLRSCRDREHKFNHAKSQIEKQMEDKLLVHALENVNIALSVAPKYHDLMSIKARLSEILDDVNKRVQKLNKKFSDRDIQDIDKELSDIANIQLDNEAAGNLQQKLTEAKDVYGSFFNKALQAFEQRLLKDALKNIKDALEIWPKSPEAQNLLEQINNLKAQVHNMIGQSEELLQFAKFEEAMGLLSQAQKLCPQIPELKNAFDSLDKLQKDYITRMENVLTAAKSKDLQAAVAELQNVLKICPQSVDARSRLKELKHSQLQARELIDKAMAFVPSAGFDDASVLLSKVKDIWVTMPEIDKAFEDLRIVSDNYISAMEDSQELFDLADADGALNSIKVAIKLCPVSEQAKLLLKNIKIAKVKKLIISAVSAMESAEFADAEKLLSEAKQSCPDHEDIQTIQTKLKNVRKSYTNYIGDAKFNISRKHFALALEALEKAKEVCPNSNELKNLIDIVKNAEERWQNIKQIIKKFGEKLLVWCCILVSQVLGNFWIFRDWSEISLLIVVLCYVAAVMGLLKMLRAGRDINRVETFLLIGSIILAVSGLSAVILHKIAGLVMPLAFIIYSVYEHILRFIKKAIIAFAKIITSRGFIISYVAIAVFAAGAFGVRFFTLQWKQDASKVSDSVTQKTEFVSETPAVSDSIKAKPSGVQDQPKVHDQQILSAKPAEAVADTAMLDSKLNSYRSYMLEGNKAAEDLKDIKLAMDMYQKAKGQLDCPEINKVISDLAEKVSIAIDDNLKQAAALMSGSNEEEAYNQANAALEMARQLNLTGKIEDILKLLEKIKWKINPGNLSWQKIAAERIDTIGSQKNLQKEKIRYYYNSIGMKFVNIVPQDESEKSYYISATEVTNSQWESVMGKTPGWFFGANIPVSGISWEQSREFCSRLSQKDGLSYNLPTRKQWQHACCCGQSLQYHCGSNITTEFANFSPASGDAPAPKEVGSYPANSWGIYDMHGNVSEWCLDKDSELTRILKGGSYKDNAEKIKSSFIESDSPRGKMKYYGLRVVIELQ